jgi:hypothetical protein
MTGTFGRRGSGSSASHDLQSSLASRLRARTASLGSTLFFLTWKQRVTPLGRSISALRASGRRTSGSDCGSWPTPQASDFMGGPDIRRDNGRPNSTMATMATMASWPTPMAGTPARNGYNEAGNTDSSRKTVFLCGVDLVGAGITADPNWSGPVRLTASGEIRTGSSAEMVSGGRLNPEHPRWLIGLPPAWDDCAVTAMRSLPRKRRKS